MERSSRNCFGPMWELRPVCCGSIWYIGFPAAVAATGEGDGLAAATRDGDAKGEGAGLVLGLTVETDATRALAGGTVGGCVGFASGAGVGWSNGVV